MNISVKKLPKSQTELTVELTPDEMKPHLEKAAAMLSTNKPIEGFRPGKAPLDVVQKKFGDMTVLDAAAEEAIKATYPKAVVEQKLLPVGAPEIGVTKMAPGNPFVYTATISTLPEVTLCDIKTLSVPKKEVVVHDEDTARAIKDLRVMRATETVTTNASGPKDLVVVDMDMKLDGVPLDGGQTKGHRVYLDEPYYIPGLTAQLTGVKKDEVKNFKLEFPKDHYQKNVAGKPVEFIITVKDVFQRTLPEVNDEFAKTLGQKDVAELNKLIHENLMNEAKQKESQREEIAALEEIVKHSKFGDIPEKLVTEEVRRMIDELRNGILQRGMDWKQYLTDGKKTEEQIALDLVPQAIGRIKVALVVRAVAQAENIEVTDAEVATEVERQMNLYSDDAETQAQIRTEDYQDRLRMVLRNRKVVEFVKNLIVR